MSTKKTPQSSLHSYIKFCHSYLAWTILRTHFAKKIENLFVLLSHHNLTSPARHLHFNHWLIHVHTKGRRFDWLIDWYGLTSFSNIEIVQRRVIGIADSAVVQYACNAGDAVVPLPTKPCAARLTQAARFAIVQSRDYRLWQVLTTRLRHPVLEPRERVSACSYTDHRPHSVQT